MQSYSRAPARLLLRIPMVLFVTALAFFVGGYFLENLTLTYLVTGAALLLGAGVTFFGGDIKIEIDPDGVMRYYKVSALKETFLLRECATRYTIRRQQGLFSVPDITLFVSKADGRETSIDCSPLGPRKFDEMIAHIRTITNEATEVLSAPQPPQT